MLLTQDEGVKTFIADLTAQLSEWLEAGKLQMLVLVIMSKASGEVLESWNFSIETDSEVVEKGFNFELSFEESVFGVQQDIEVHCLEECGSCDGTGARSSSCVKVCSDCGGRGGTVTTEKTPFGIMSVVSKCSKCGGNGKIVTGYCKKCAGHGQVRSKRSIEVVPPGVHNGATMQV